MQTLYYLHVGNLLEYFYMLKTCGAETSDRGLCGCEADIIHLIGRHCTINMILKLF